MDRRCDFCQRNGHSKACPECAILNLEADRAEKWMRRYDELEADNAKLRANIVAAMALRDELRHDVEVLTADNVKLRAEVAKLNEGLDYAVGQLVTEADDLLRARLASAEAVCEAVNEFWDTARDDDTMPFKVVRALEKWREGKG